MLALFIKKNKKISALSIHIYMVLTPLDPGFSIKIGKRSGAKKQNDGRRIFEGILLSVEFPTSRIHIMDQIYIVIRFLFIFASTQTNLYG